MIEWLIGWLIGLCLNPWCVDEWWAHDRWLDWYNNCWDLLYLLTNGGCSIGPLIDWLLLCDLILIVCYWRSSAWFVDESMRWLIRWCLDWFFLVYWILDVCFLLMIYWLVGWRIVDWWMLVRAVLHFLSVVYDLMYIWLAYWWIFYLRTGARWSDVLVKRCIDCMLVYVLGTLDPWFVNLWFMAYLFIDLFASFMLEWVMVYLWTARVFLWNGWLLFGWLIMDWLLGVMTFCMICWMISSWLTECWLIDGLIDRVSD